MQRKDNYLKKAELSTKQNDKMINGVSLQRRCANNLNQAAIHANTYGVYQSEIAALQKDYTELW